MIAPIYQFTPAELKKLLSSLVVIIDTREQQNGHIVRYFDQKGIPHEAGKLDHCDYSAMIPAAPDIGVIRPLYFDVAIERKNSVDELAASIKDRTRFESEFRRARGGRFVLMVEDADGYEDIVRHRYRSRYNPKALLASLKTFEARYGFTTAFVKKELAGNYIYYHLYYAVRNVLKSE
jgi:ERCC4-type nuclease